ncbi:hypothetical protein DY037_07080 [Apilactobacillus micheneri]|nr:hypothetical protein DY037_07080 [Apilactobacillus micheneri]
MQQIFRTKSLNVSKGLKKACDIVHAMNRASSINGIDTYHSLHGNIMNVTTKVDVTNDFGFFKIFKCKYYIISVYIYNKSNC